MSRRKENANSVRQQASRTAFERPHPQHIANEDEQRFRHNSLTANAHKTEAEEAKAAAEEAGDPTLASYYTDQYNTELDIEHQPAYLMSFTKGMPHSFETGLLFNPAHFKLFVRAIDSGDARDFRDTPLGHPANCLGNVCSSDALGWRSAAAQNNGDPVNVRAWESQSAGNSFDLEGPDAQAVTMPPAPALGKPELIAEMAEVYAQAILRDVPFHSMSAGINGHADRFNIFKTFAEDYQKVNDLTRALNGLDWFIPDGTQPNPIPIQPAQIGPLNEQEEARRRRTLNPGNAFRGITKGDDVGPYLSQFLLAGNKGIHRNDDERSPIAGLITYGAINIDQKVRTAPPEVDFMTSWEEWFDVQNGADLRAQEDYEIGALGRRFIYTPRDLATYVHYDALYEAYLNACLMMLGMGIPFDPGIPFQESDNRDHQQGFAHFGGPHILSLVTEVATRALKAVRFQKFNVHRRCRPEVLAARIHKTDTLSSIAPELLEMRQKLMDRGILGQIETLNGTPGNYLLPMAFPEGSPMHPAYGAGHATVAGACVTILKAFFDHTHRLEIVPMNSGRTEDQFPNGVQEYADNLSPSGTAVSSNFAYVSIQDGEKLCPVPVIDKKGKLAHLTVEGELNKLASNIAIGRDWAGVHYFTDYYESILMGEQIAIGILEEQKLTYAENFSMTLPLFGGGTRRI